jgi:Transglutaminase-like superfamily
MAIFTAVFPALVRLNPLQLESLLLAKGPLSKLTPDSVQRIPRYYDLILRLGNPFIRSGCLRRGITLYYFLTRAGLEVSLCFGTGSPEGRFAGHCWLVRDGAPFLEKTDPRPTFTEMFRIPGAAGASLRDWARPQAP